MTDGGTFLDDEELGPTGPGFCPVCLEDLRGDGSCPTCQPARARVAEPDRAPTAEPVHRAEVVAPTGALPLRSTVGGSILWACWWTFLAALGLGLAVLVAGLLVVVGIVAGIVAGIRHLTRARRQRKAHRQYRKMRGVHPRLMVATLLELHDNERG